MQRFHNQQSRSKTDTRGQCRMYLINVKAFLKRDDLIKKKKEVDRRMEVIECCDESKEYAILSHRWIGKEIKYEEMVELAQMGEGERDEIRQRDGYKKIFYSCAQAAKDGHQWLWADTCCIDKRSSAELSEAINSMYRWYENSRVCYVYLHDVHGSSFPTARNDTTYANSNGYPEWFSRGWTLQEMIAPSHVQFFNKNWKPIGDKRMLAHTLKEITRVPEQILRDGLSSSRPCVAQIMSWAAKRMTTRVEDRAYSLLGLLDVNMPMLYGEGKKAFQRLQLEIIRMSNDQSIFAWLGNDRTSSILADDPSYFVYCNEMESMDRNEYIEALEEIIPAEDRHSIDDNRFGTYLTTNRGIQIWMLLRSLKDSDLVFEAWLPCRSHPSSRPVRITLALWKSNYYRYSAPGERSPGEQTPEFRQVYLRYQDPPHRDTTIEIDDSALTKIGFTYCGMYPWRPTRNTFTLTGADPLCVQVYSNTQARCRFAVCLGQCFGQDWIHFVYEKPASDDSFEDFSQFEYNKMLVRGPEHARSMAEVRSRGGCHGHIWVKHICPPGSLWTIRTSCVIWENSTKCGIRIDGVPDPYNGPGEWTSFDVDGTNDPNCDIRGLMIRHSPKNGSYTLLVDGVSMDFSQAFKPIKLGDYGYITDPEDFCCTGNIFDDFKYCVSERDITPRQHKIDDKNGHNTTSHYVEAYDSIHFRNLGTLYNPCGQSLPSNHNFNSLLASLSTQLTNKYLVTRVISGKISRPFLPFSETKIHLYAIAKPFTWHQDEGDEMRTGMGSEE
ncbi:heterokaryon incompatibility protein-domain-containing protein [Scleroderma yunnanense]